MFEYWEYWWDLLNTARDEYDLELAERVLHWVQGAQYALDKVGFAESEAAMELTRLEGEFHRLVTEILQRLE